ncbi:ABC-F family ATP-binding cassette domain-containing protein [Nesterenkonia sp. HG001]|uniref:ABC-F family ATP-binding cassette domain-containing protein n=1 Tax=Nesterenkonia sp. HG001 TaxID=2983207 RepID=UPI002AC4148D|nr:ATP-binding cassette domain-containing protein [Nesterenkonia sp. HG001]MDZ5078810.1 ATP-binding cassette domain-containing protein [Nesterenkonia sp. HG001]
MLHPTGAVTCTDLIFRHADGTSVLDGVTFSLGPGRHGIVGDNGSGKTTLLGLLAGELRSTSGTAHVVGELASLPQDPAPDPRRPVAALLGVADTFTALRRIEAGSVAVEDFETVGDDWDLDERLTASLARVGLEGIDLDRPSGTLSGGELMLLSLTGLLLRRPDVLLLDEPTNNLDAQTRSRVHDVVATFPGTLLVVSHDRTLLDRLDAIGEVRDGGVRWFGGGLSFYEDVVAAEQEAAAQAVATARSDARRQQRDLVTQHVKQARRDRQGRKKADSLPPIVAHAYRRRAEESAGRLRTMHEGRLEDAREHLQEAERRVRHDAEIRIDLPDTAVPAQRDVLRARGLRAPHGSTALDLTMRGPERVALTGPNGVGKTSLLRCLTGQQPALSGEAEILVPHRLLPQNLHVLDPALSVLENVQRAAPETDPTRIRHQLALFLLRGDAVHQPAGSLSGGERWRATLASMLLAEPAPQLLILDEPTNNLDFASVRHLIQSLQAHHGALLVVSHDEHFLDQLDLDRRITLTGTKEPSDA